jgi:ligand-binding sensor domain-containing protein
MYKLLGRRLAFALFIAGGARLAAPAPLPAPVSEEASWRAVDLWRQAQGLPQSSIIAIHQTKDGYLWVGTKGGVARFDGVRFTSFRSPRELTESEIWALAETRDGALWVGTYGSGLIRVGKGEPTVYTSEKGLLSDFICAVCEDPQGALWIGTEKGLNRFQGGTFTRYTEAEGLQHNAVRALRCEADGAVWIGTNRGALQELRNGRIHPNVIPEPLPGVINSIARAADGTLWVAANTALYRSDGGAFEPLGTADGLITSRSYRVFIDPAGNVWISTAAGLTRYRDGRFVPYDITIPGSTKQNVTAMVGDDEGSLWIGHGAGGLARLGQGQFVSYSARDGLSGNYVTAVIEDRRGALWIGTPEGLTRYQNRRFSRVVGKNRAAASITALAETRDGTIWVGTPNVLYRMAPTSCEAAECVEDLQTVSFGADRPDAAIRLLYVDAHDGLWVGSDQHGLLRHQDGRFTRYTTRDGLPDHTIRGVSEDLDGSLWIGTRRGLARLKDGRFSLFTEKEGLAGPWVQSLYRDREGVVWVGTARGINRIKDGRLTAYTVADGLFAPHIYAFLDDDLGNLWMSCGKGVFRVAKKELHDFADGKITAVQSVSYGLEHGLNTTVGSAGYYPMVCRARNGRLWFGTADGLSFIDPGRLEIDTTPPRVHVEDVTVDGAAYRLGAAVEAPPGRGDVEFRYTVLSYRSPLKTQFRVRLDPFDAEWVDPRGTRVMSYRNLPPGQYHFRVKASNSDGIWNESGDSIAVRLAPHFYQTRWFYLLCGGAVAFLAFGAHRLRVHALQERERELKVRVQEAIAHIKELRGLLPICASCKKIRDDNGYWNQMESYLQAHNVAEFSHSVCPDCIAKLYPDYHASQNPPSSV